MEGSFAFRYFAGSGASARWACVSAFVNASPSIWLSKVIAHLMGSSRSSAGSSLVGDRHVEACRGICRGACGERGGEVCGRCVAMHVERPVERAEHCCPHGNQV